MENTHMHNCCWHNPDLKENPQAAGGSEAVWQCVHFGRYPQTEVLPDSRLIEADWKDSRIQIDSETYVRIPFADTFRYFREEPIRWRILDVKDGQLLLLSEKVLDTKAYHEVNQEVTWENCTLRSWLNGYGKECNRAGVDYVQNSFLKMAFRAEEITDVVPHYWENPDNYYFGTSCGKATEDAVIIPAEKEILFTENAEKYGFSPRDEVQDGAKQLLPTDFAVARGVWISQNKRTQNQVFWFTRTSGYTQANVVYMDEEGCGYNRGIVVSCQDGGILPMLYVREDSNYLLDAGTCSSWKHADMEEELSSKTSTKIAVYNKSVDAGTLSGPVVEQDETAHSGQKTVWNTLYLGHYPMTEILQKEDNAVDDYAENLGDHLVLPELYEKLEKAEFVSDMAELEGQRYFRVRPIDTMTGADRGIQHYQIQTPETYHYFRCDQIRWRILENDGKVLTLVADRVLDCKTFHDKAEEVNWEGSSLRAWLNSYKIKEPADVDANPKDGFLYCAFTEKERKVLRHVCIKNQPNIAYGTSCGRDTEDYVHLLSQMETFGEKAADYGFYAGGGMDDNAKRFRSTRYAKFQGTWWSPVEDYKGNAFWFMRNSGYSAQSVSYICDFGYIYNRGTMVDCNDAGILPVIHVDAHAEYSFAGTVCSEEILR